MTGFRNKSWRRLGATLSGLALVQLMLSSLGLAMAGAAPEPADAFGGHALCLAGGANPPAGEAPAPPAHNHFSFCCPWHQPPGIQPAAIAPSLPIAFSPITPAQPGLAALVPGPRRGPANARAPPTRA